MIRLSQTWRQKQTASNTAVAVKNTSHTSDIEGWSVWVILNGWAFKHRIRVDFFVNDFMI